MKTRGGLKASPRKSAGAVKAKPDGSFPIPLTTLPMETVSAEALPKADGVWQYEPKWDGFRCLAFKQDSAVELRAKSGKPLGRYFPEVVAFLVDLPVPCFVVDGELVIEVDKRLSFEALQMRLHPAESRIRKFAAATPARLTLFDMLVAPDGANLLNEPLSRRREILEAFIASAGVSKTLTLSPRTLDYAEAEGWVNAAGRGETDGVVAKRLDGVYEPGQRAMIKVKHLRTADCVVGGFRYESGGHQVGSLLLGLYDDEGKLNHVGYTSTISDVERPALTRQLEALRQPPGFTGQAPGGPSRWSTERSGEWMPVRPVMVAEVRFDHVTDGRFRHGTKMIRWRPDKAPRQCTLQQIAPARAVA